MKLIEILKLSTEYLKNKSIESPRLTAELMLCKILDCDRLSLYINFDKPLNDEEIEMMRSFLKRRVKNEPLQYILGREEFFGLNFLVNKNVLIPRPETEFLVQAVINEYKNKNAEILEVGTGSGNIAISVAKNLPESKIYSIDISEEAIEVAKENAKNNDVNNVFFSNNDIFNYNDIRKYDAIISNPPYIHKSEIPKLQPEITNYEPHIALFVDDEMHFFKQIIEVGEKLLKEQGKIFFECGQGQADRIETLFLNKGFKIKYIIKDLQNIERIIIGEKTSESCNTESF